MFDEDSDSDSDDDAEEQQTGRILVFTTAENLRRLFRADTWFADGTFKIAVQRCRSIRRIL